MFATTNPDAPRHWLKTGFIDSTDPDLDLVRFHFTLDDNPALSREFVTALEAEHTEVWRQRLIEGLLVAAEGAIYPAIRDADTSRLPDPATVEGWWLGVDYGTTNPTHAILLALAEDRLWAVDEWRWDSKTEGRQLTDAQISRRLAHWIQGPVRHRFGQVVLDEVSVDPSAASLRVPRVAGLRAETPCQGEGRRFEAGHPLQLERAGQPSLRGRLTRVRGPRSGAPGAAGGPVSPTRPLTGERLTS